MIYLYRYLSYYISIESYRRSSNCAYLFFSKTSQKAGIFCTVRRSEYEARFCRSTPARECFLCTGDDKSTWTDRWTCRNHSEPGLGRTWGGLLGPWRSHILPLHACQSSAGSRHYLAEHRETESTYVRGVTKDVTMSELMEDRRANT